MPELDGFVQIVKDLRTAKVYGPNGTPILEAMNWIADRIEAALAAHDQKMREPLTAWMIENSFATGHGDTVEDLLKELKWQIKESNQKVRREIECQIILQLMGAEPYLGRGHVESGGEFIWTVVADKVSVLALASPAQAANKPEASHE